MNWLALIMVPPAVVLAGWAVTELVMVARELHDNLKWERSHKEKTSC